MKKTVAETATTIWDGLLDQSPWSDYATFEQFVREREDDNGDDYLCLLTTWGDDLNPNSHWFGVEQFIVVDNTANGSNH